MNLRRPRSAITKSAGQCFASSFMAARKWPARAEVSTVNPFARSTAAASSASFSDRSFLICITVPRLPRASNHNSAAEGGALSTTANTRTAVPDGQERSATSLTTCSDLRE